MKNTRNKMEFEKDATLEAMKTQARERHQQSTESVKFERGEFKE